MVETFSVLVSHFSSGLVWAVKIIAALLLLGVLAEIASWIVGPSRGMFVAAQQGILPPTLAKVNKNGVPVALVITQLIITTIAIVVLTNTGGGAICHFLLL